MAAWMAGGRESRRSIPARPRPRPTRARRVCEPIRQARKATFQETLHSLAPRPAADPCGARTRHFLEIPARQSLMGFSRSSSDPVSLRSILEVSTIMSDRSVSDQLGSYTPLPPPRCPYQSTYSEVCKRLCLGRHSSPDRGTVLPAIPRLRSTVSYKSSTVVTGVSPRCDHAAPGTFQIRSSFAPGRL